MQLEERTIKLYISEFMVQKSFSKSKTLIVLLLTGLCIDDARTLFHPSSTNTAVDRVTLNCLTTYSGASLKEMIVF